MGDNPYQSTHPSSPFTITHLSRPISKNFSQSSPDSAFPSLDFFPEPYLAGMGQSAATPHRFEAPTNSRFSARERGFSSEPDGVGMGQPTPPPHRDEAPELWGCRRHGFKPQICSSTSVSVISPPPPLSLVATSSTDMNRSRRGLQLLSADDGEEEEADQTSAGDGLIGRAEEETPAAGVAEAPVEDDSHFSGFSLPSYLIRENPELWAKAVVEADAWMEEKMRKDSW